MNTIIQIGRKFVSFTGLVDHYTKSHAVFVPTRKTAKAKVLSEIAEKFGVAVDDLILLQ